MKRIILGFFIIAMASLLISCPNPVTVPPADQPITLLAIPGIVAPVRDAVPVTTAIDTAQYTGTISWSPIDNPFSSSTVYTANIALTAKTGWTMIGVAVDSFTVAGATATSAVNTGSVAAVFPATDAPTDQAITLLAIPGIVAPVRDAVPVTTAIDTAQYTGTISWSPIDNPFSSSTVYTANIALTAKTGWTMIGVAVDSFTVAGATATSAVNTGSVAAVFPATDAPTDQAITLLAIPGIVAPVRDAVPVTTAIDTAQYTGTISWPPIDNPFSSSTVYTANIALTAKTGWTMIGMAVDSFTVAGATATSAVNTGSVAAVFPATDAPTDQAITLLAIPGIVAPVRDAVPVTTAIDTAQYTGTISWSPIDNPFSSSTVYTANIALTAKTGWTMIGVAVDSFTVAGATVTNAVNTGTVAAVFLATLPSDYTSPNIGTLKGVPAGSFQRDGTPANISTITTAYRMSEKEITRAQFVLMLTTDPSDETYSSGTTDDPVQMTNWYHAVAFCNKLSIAEGLTPVYSVTGVNFTTLTYAAIPKTSNTDWDEAAATWTNNGYRLPTEMEWMWAAMGAPSDGQGGGTNTTGYTKGYAGSTETVGVQVNIGNYAWYSGNSSNTTHPAGTKTVNELGLYDMSGNVWEWCWDWLGTYPIGTATDYRGAESESGRVVRGGSYGNIASACTVAARTGDSPYGPGHSIGFRVVRP